MDVSNNEPRLIEHTYAFLKTGPGNRYLPYAEAWGGFYIGFEGFPLDLLAKTYEEDAAKLADAPGRSYFQSLQEIYRVSLPEWRGKVRLALWNRTTCCLEIWQPTDQLKPFPRKFVANLFDSCSTEAELPRSKEWRHHLEGRSHLFPKYKWDRSEDPLDRIAGPSGCRFLPARRLCDPIRSELLYAPIDTLSVLQQLNRRTFAYMTRLDPSRVPWPADLFEGRTVFVGPDGDKLETGYGRFVREYMDGIVDSTGATALTNLTREQRMILVCATVNPLLVETAAMLFALDLGMVIDSGQGKGRQGIDVVAACGTRSTPQGVLSRLQQLGLRLPTQAESQLIETGVLCFQCKGYDGDAAIDADRIVEFRPVRESGNGRHGVSLVQVLRLARDPQITGFHHLNAWLERMCDAVLPRRSSLETHL